MKLLINNIPIPYSGECTIERNMPFFLDEGLENSYSYTFNVPMYNVTQKLFNYADRVNSEIPDTDYDIKLIHQTKTYAKGVARLNGVEDGKYIINITDEGSSVYGQFSELMLNDLALDKYEFATYADYLSWAKSIAESTSDDSPINYPLLHCPDLFTNAEGEDYAVKLEEWEQFPVVNHWHELRNSKGEIYPHTMLFPIINAKYLYAKIYEKTGVSMSALVSDARFMISGNFHAKTPGEVLLSGKAYREEEGKIIVDISDFIPRISVLDFLSIGVKITNSFVYGENHISRNRDFVIKSKPEGIDISEYVVDYSQKFVAAKRGWILSFPDKSIVSGNGEFEVSFSNGFTRKKYYWSGTDVYIGSVDVALGDDELRDFFGLKQQTHSMGENRDDYDTLFGITAESLASMYWRDYLNWYVKKKRKLTLTCVPDKYLIEKLTNELFVAFKSKQYIVESMRFELLAARVGMVRVVIVEF